MLVLTRRTGESVLIGNDIKVLILKTNRREIKIGIQAPSNLKISRGVSSKNNSFDKEFESQVDFKN